MPKLPKEDIKILVRPQGGLNIVKVGAPIVAVAIFVAASMTEAVSAEGTVCPNAHQNIIVVSTPKRVNADRYARIRQISIQDNSTKPTRMNPGSTEGWPNIGDRSALPGP
ncbi:hypothetical protein HPB51_027996 [Rhipicephalus microplus]|uniref:Uncharacterized protein n=1 Tax=Rhipicephalus microplus TaxID=6941 RepID=A0A9J6CYJ4_RHIMP|nr:hypothetical protein HPB51_027996 [Rhipicephalus microplus]